VLWVVHLQDSRVIVITAGARQNEGESRLDLVQKNITIFKEIVPELVKYSPDAVIVVVTNPCDIMAWVTWKLSGLPSHRVFASGTMLDTSRFRQLLADRFNVSAHHCHGSVVSHTANRRGPFLSPYCGGNETNGQLASGIRKTCTAMGASARPVVIYHGTGAQNVRLRNHY